jgi:hypothetical protein
MPNIEKLQNKLEQKYKAIQNIPKDKIGCDFFVVLSDYVNIIDKSDYLRKLLHSSKVFNFANPHNLIIQRGRSVADINKALSSKRVSNIFTAFFNLYAVYVGIQDLDYGIEKDDLTENRLRMVKHLKNIRDREKIIGTGYFWVNKNKYHEWARVVQRHISDLIDKDSNTKEVKAEAKPNKGNISYRCDLDNQLAWFVFNNEEMEFKGKRAIVFNFFYTLNNIGDNEYKTYHDFNKYLLDKTINTKIDSIAFRQSIDNINKRVKNELGDIKSVIELKDKNNPKEINRYKWKIKI